MAISIPIISDFNARGIDNAIAQFKRLETTGERAQLALLKAAGPATAALAGLAAGAGLAVKKASDLQETTSKVGQIFGNANDDIRKFARDASKNIGQSEKAALDATATFGIFGKAAGLAGEDLSKFAIDFTTLATDLASFNNTNPEDAVLAIGAAMRGESEPIRRYGVLINDAAIKQQALEMGLISTTKKALDPQTKALATARAIMKQTSDQQGDFARTSDGLAGQLKILKARADDLVAAFGQALLPIAETLTTYLNGIAQVVEDNTPLFGALAAAIAIFSTAILVANGALKAWRTIAAVTTGINFALGTSFTAVQVATGVGIATALIGVGAFLKIKGAMDKASASAMKYAGAAGFAALNQQQLNEYQGPVPSRNLAEFTKFYDDYAATLSEVDTTTNNVKEKTKELAKTLKTSFTEALDDANERLKEARKEFKEYADTVSKNIEGNINYGAISDAGKETGTSFLTGLESQTKQVTDFGVLVNRLIAAGLNEQALQQVISAGSTVGSRIANEILNTADGVLKVNTLTQQLQTVANLAGANAAGAFKQAGITQGQALVDGIKSIVDKYRIKLSSKGLNAKQIKRLQNNFNVDVEFAMSSGIPALADGGIVTGPTMALIGEAGPEAVVPLDRMGGMGNVTINVNGGDPEAVVQALRRYMNRYGNIPIRTTAP
jgi:hypothetical protein